MKNQVLGLKLLSVLKLTYYIVHTSVLGKIGGIADYSLRQILFLSYSPAAPEVSASAGDLLVGQRNEFWSEVGYDSIFLRLSKKTDPLK